MRAKKSPKHSLEKKRPVFFQIGLLISLSLTFVAFEWTTVEITTKAILGELANISEEPEQTPIVILEKILVKQLPPATEQPVNVDQLLVAEIVPNDTPMEETSDFSDEMPEIDFGIEVPVEEDVIHIVVESMPEFPGGMAGLGKYLGIKIKYPEMAKEAGILGTVYVTFVVDKKGRISDVKLLRGIGGGCDEEAIRVIKSMPRWKAGKQRGKAVQVQFNLPVRFDLY